MIAGLVAGLGAIGYKMLVKLIGYEFVARTVCIAADEWSKSTKDHWDDKVVAAMKKALEVE